LVPSSELVYFAFRRQDDVAVPCSRALAAHCCGFGPDDVYRVEISVALTTAILGTPRTTKAKWVRVLSGSDLASLGIAALAGEPVIAAFLREELVGAQYVALYRRKHWPLDGSAHGVSCSGHTHLQVTWARLPSR
jgi:hypothetical protein